MYAKPLLLAIYVFPRLSFVLNSSLSIGKRRHRLSPLHGPGRWTRR
jgi:hypothetical protein